MDEASDTIEKRLHRGGMGLGGCFSRARFENLLKLEKFGPSGPPLDPLCYSGWARVRVGCPENFLLVNARPLSFWAAALAAASVQGSPEQAGGQREWCSP